MLPAREPFPPTFSEFIAFLSSSLSLSPLLNPFSPFLCLCSGNDKNEMEDLSDCIGCRREVDWSYESQAQRSTVPNSIFTDLIELP